MHDPPPMRRRQRHGCAFVSVLCLLQGLASDIHPIRQSAVYGAGVLAEVGGPAFTPLLPQVIQLLTASVQHPVRWATSTAILPPHAVFTVALVWRVLQAAASERAAEVTKDNAVSALVKLLSSRGEEIVASGVDPKSVLQVILSALPLCGDDDEARVVHAWVVEGLKPGSTLAAILPAPVVPRLLQAIISAFHAFHAGRCRASCLTGVRAPSHPAAHESSVEANDFPLCDDDTVAAITSMIGVRARC